jgi:hypothetical protein
LHHGPVRVAVEPLGLALITCRERSSAARSRVKPNSARSRQKFGDPNSSLSVSFMAKKKKRLNDHTRVTAELDRAVSQARTKRSRTPTPSVNRLMKTTSDHAFNMDPLGEVLRAEAELKQRGRRRYLRELTRIERGAAKQK